MHVVGTNGKGTVAAYLDAGLRAAGWATGRFTSPHVEAFGERIHLDGAPIDHASVASFLARLEETERREGLDPAAFFEACTAMALDAFAQRRLPWAVVEAGIGAAHDATAAVDNVRMVIVTNVAEDHTNLLGPGLQSVASDKAQAIRPGVPVVTGADGAALQVLATVASRRRSPLFFDLGSAPLFEVDPEVRAPGGTRGANQRLAAAALRLLEVPEAAVRAGLAAPPLPARGESFWVDGRQVLLDGAHNPAAAAGLAREVPPGYTLLAGVLQRRLPQEILAALAPGADSVLLTTAEAGERPWGEDARFVADPIRALRRALDLTPGGGRVLVAGSLHLAGAVRPWLRARSAPGTP